ncbi:MFS transporter [Spiractinospora alimapuensis]|uniref:MFS transporter n=1 Tax=Spiractinospora alimapuensis TaxID=2820884 RepID=UPI001F2FA4AF|nr:MFS transporter [Spiractinospora alimapuensis]QVQ52721.1 MFS transporter [Spiractinospora alimapuensis]
MPGWLFALAAAALVFYTDDYVIAGVLPEVAADLGVSEAAAGQLVTAFSVTVAIAAPVAAVTLARVGRRGLLTGAALVFVVANALAAATPNYEILLGLRILAALAAAAATPTLFATAAQLSPPERIGRSVATVAFGVTGAVAVGVPVGTWIGAGLGWRATFGFMALAGIAVAVGFLRLLPRTSGTVDVPPLGEQFAILVRPAISLGLTANLVLMFGSMMMLTYLAPLVTDLAAVGPELRGGLFALSGVAGMVGIWASGRVVDRWGADRTLLIGVGAFVASMATIAALWPLRPIPVLVLVLVSLVWSGSAFWNSPAVQARLHLLAGPVSAQALALNTSGTYLGVAVGGAVGGVVLTVTGPGGLPIVAGAAGVLAAGLFALAAAVAPARVENAAAPETG